MAKKPAANYDELLKKGIQAVCIADSFENKFVPLYNTSNKNPSCLMPVVNVPNIHYVIEFLLMNEVKEIFIATSKSTRQLVDQFIRK